MHAVLTNVATAISVSIAVGLIIPPVPSVDGQTYSFSRVFPIQMAVVVLGGIVNRFRPSYLLLDIAAIGCILAIAGWVSYGRAFGF